MTRTRAASLAYVDLRNLVWSSCLSKYDSAVRIRDGISGLLQVLIMLAAQPLSLKPGSLLTANAISCLMAHPSTSQWNSGADGRPSSSGHSSAPPPFRRSCSRRQHQEAWKHYSPLINCVSLHARQSARLVVISARLSSCLRRRCACIQSSRSRRP